ncbi:MAG: acyl carrier protein [Calditrichaeota bacterium]|nr:MAG: acyl carrier protein [Calditrichota bacterium]
MHKEILDFLYDESMKEDFDGLDYDDSMLELGLIDSLKMVELVNFIQEKYGIEIDDDELMPENFDSINAIVDFIKSKKG